MVPGSYNTKQYRYFIMITASDFIHPEDASALEQLESIPGVSAFVKKILELGLEKMQYGINMASAIRLSTTQLPDLYNRLPPICKKLGIEYYIKDSLIKEM